jgi:hypothetical protein
MELSKLDEAKENFEKHSSPFPRGIQFMVGLFLGSLYLQQYTRRYLQKFAIFVQSKTQSNSKHRLPMKLLLWSYSTTFCPQAATFSNIPSNPLGCVSLVLFQSLLMGSRH